MCERQKKKAAWRGCSGGRREGEERVRTSEIRVSPGSVVRERAKFRGEFLAGQGRRPLPALFGAEEGSVAGDGLIGSEEGGSPSFGGRQAADRGSLTPDRPSAVRGISVTGQAHRRAPSTEGHLGHEAPDRFVVDSRQRPQGPTLHKEKTYTSLVVLTKPEST
ncbi:hypothetical protein HPB47_011770 [Ixodes persulcatus]|uniref:Uncharacterized protein n=1 Tax=Ixodes persulcatus TaxID=34615 RepID=A0AC60NVQ6_IXOPE|nr:hypothetical protein HPB47_011770 [Ixodes persulcatus]